MKNRFSTWGDARVFLAVTREGSTLQASKILGMTQTTVARRVEAFEHALGLTLFEKDTRGFRLTGAGKDLLPAAEALEAAADALATKATALARPSTIRLTAPSVLVDSDMVEATQRFARENGDIRFEFLPAEHKLDIASGEADIAFRFGDEPTEPDLIVRKLFVGPLSIYGSKDYVARNGAPATPEDIYNHDVLFYTDTTGQSSRNRFLRTHGNPARVVSNCAEMHAMRAAIESGLGIGLLSTPYARKAGLVEFFPPDTVVKGAMGWLVIAPDAWQRPEVKAFAKYIVPELRRAWTV